MSQSAETQGDILKNKGGKLGKDTKYIFVTGGVLSGLGKGIFGASIGNILKSRGFAVNMQKCDPYLNVDAGTLNPGEHGEVFVTDDGAETDLDLGHYERFIDTPMSKLSSVMSGRIYTQVLEDERKGKYLGKTVQVIPHITNKIQENIMKAAGDFDIHIVEIGGTVGDYEGLHFIEAIRQMRRKVGRENVLYAHLVYLPFIETSKEIKTKPAQNSVRDLLQLGIHANIVGCRADHAIAQSDLSKIALFSDIDEQAVVALPTIKSVYQVPGNLEAAGLGEYIVEHLNLPKRKPVENGLAKYLADLEKAKKAVRVGLIAKYMANEDTYKSVNEAIQSASVNNGACAEIIWLDAEEIEKNGVKELAELDGIVVPGGFGNRGTLGKIMAAQYARENNVPYLGLCLGMQIATIEFARNVLGWKTADSEEFVPEGDCNVIHIMPEQKAIMDDDNYGASMRLGAYPCVLDKGSKSFELYGVEKISERHRHRFEFNNDHREEFTAAGLRFAGLSPNHHLVEIVEIPEHKFYIGVQFHPEFKSRPGRPHPLFDGFVKAILN